MKTSPHRMIIGGSITLLSLLVCASAVSAQTNASSTSTISSGSSQSPTEGIQKRDNEWGIWGGISFDSPTLIGKRPNARFGNLGLRYGRVLAASKTVAFEWTIDAIPLAVFSGKRDTSLFLPPPGFNITQLRRTV